MKVTPLGYRGPIIFENEVVYAAKRLIHALGHVGPGELKDSVRELRELAAAQPGYETLLLAVAQEAQDRETVQIRAGT